MIRPIVLVNQFRNIVNNKNKTKNRGCHHCGEKCWGNGVISEPCYGIISPIWVEVTPGEWQWLHQCDGHCFLTPGYFPENHDNKRQNK